MDFSGIIHAVRDFNERAAEQERPKIEMADVHQAVLKERAQKLRAEREAETLDRLRIM